jgi:hypothetical protein
MGGLSVFSQTELVEPVSEASVAQAIAEHEKGRRRLRLFGVRTAVGFLMLLALGLLVYGMGKKPATAQRSLLASESVCRGDEWSQGKVWKDALSEAIKPGNALLDPMIERDGHDWSTGQSLPVKGPDSIDRVTWTVIDREVQLGSQFIRVRVDRKLSLDVVRLITERLLSAASSPGCETSWVKFYTDWSLKEVTRDRWNEPRPEDWAKIVSWADCRFEYAGKAKLHVRINCLTLEEEAKLKDFPLPPRAANVIGKWIDEDFGGRRVIYWDSGDYLHMERIPVFTMTPHDDDDLVELPSLVGRRFEHRYSKGDDYDVNYFAVQEAGDLETHWKDGDVSRSQRIR